MVQGLEQLQRRWNAIPARLKKEVEAVMEKTADEIVRDMKKLAPPDQSGDLRRSIRWTWGDAPKGSLTIGTLDNGREYGALRLTIYAGGEEAFYARFVEFGTAPGVRGDRIASYTGGRRSRVVQRSHPGTVAQPFFFPAWRIWRRRVRGRIAAAVRRAIAAG